MELFVLMLDVLLMTATAGTATVIVTSKPERLDYMVGGSMYLVVVVKLVTIAMR